MLQNGIMPRESLKPKVVSKIDGEDEEVQCSTPEAVKVKLNKTNFVNDMHAFDSFMEELEEANKPVARPVDTHQPKGESDDDSDQNSFFSDDSDCELVLENQNRRTIGNRDTRRNHSGDLEQLLYHVRRMDATDPRSSIESKPQSLRSVNSTEKKISSSTRSSGSSGGGLNDALSRSEHRKQRGELSSSRHGKDELSRSEHTSRKTNSSKPHSTKSLESTEKFLSSSTRSSGSSGGGKNDALSRSEHKKQRGELSSSRHGKDELSGSEHTSRKANRATDRGRSGGRDSLGLSDHGSSHGTSKHRDRSSLSRDLKPQPPRSRGSLSPVPLTSQQRTLDVSQRRRDDLSQSEHRPKLRRNDLYSSAHKSRTTSSSGKGELDRSRRSTSEHDFQAASAASLRRANKRHEASLSSHRLREAAHPPRVTSMHRMPGLRHGSSEVSLNSGHLLRSRGSNNSLASRNSMTNMEGVFTPRSPHRALGSEEARRVGGKKDIDDLVLGLRRETKRSMFQSKHANATWNLSVET